MHGERLCLIIIKVRKFAKASEKLKEARKQMTEAKRRGWCRYTIVPMESVQDVVKGTYTTTTRYEMRYNYE